MANTIYRKHRSEKQKTSYNSYKPTLKLLREKIIEKDGNAKYSKIKEPHQRNQKKNGTIVIAVNPFSYRPRFV